MKKVKIFASIVLVMSMLVLPAAADEFVSSAERNDGPRLVDYEDAPEGVELILTCLEDLEVENADVPLPIEDTLNDAKKEVEELGLTGIYPDFEELWEEVTGGAPVENAYAAHIFDVRYTDEIAHDIPAGKSASFRITDECVEADDLFVLLYKPFGSDEWQEIDSEISEDNVISVTVSSTGVFLLVGDNGAAPVVEDDAPSSPQTGVYDNIGYAAAAVTACLFLAGFAVSKSFRKA